MVYYCQMVVLALLLGTLSVLPAESARAAEPDARQPQLSADPIPDELIADIRLEAPRLDGCEFLMSTSSPSLARLTLPICPSVTQLSDEASAKPLRGEMYLDENGQWISFEQAYDSYLGADRERVFSRAILIVLGELLAGGVWYLSQKDFNQQDWFFNSTVEGAAEKFSSFDLVRFDNNTFLFNQMWHPLAGMGYYFFPRVNNFGIGASYMFAIMSSTVWEYVLELPEKVSINDQITTSVSGMAMGEVAFQLGEYFNSPEIEGELDKQIVTGIFGFTRWAQNHFDPGDGRAVLVPANRTYWPDFEFFVGVNSRADEATPSGNISANIGLTTELVAMPGYQRPGQFDRFFKQGNFTYLGLEASIDEHGFNEMYLRADATLFGYYTQDIEQNRGEEKSGYSFYLGGRTSYEVANFSGPVYEDQLGLVHLLGPALDFTALSNGLGARLRLDIYGDFAAVGSHAIDFYRARYGVDGIRSELSDKGYTFSYGATIRPRLELSWRRLELGGEFQWGRYWSITGRDRYQEQVTKTLDVDDHLSRLQLWLDIPTPLDSFELRLNYDRMARLSSVDEFEKDAGYQELGARVQYTF